ncbi:ABC transporter permease [Halobacteria archaeon AArc-curdl1]|uniref:ABC transporter permease n=1 Tax=Natronosalvus hydrolyticus TaxID=2979988 RepID=A0AAP2Z9E6_9EURY|nr:ABC transporter permease [Halobacteria archaeon AArc-curdl1]
MTAILRVESRKRLRSVFILTGVFAVLAAFYFSVYPGFADDAEAIAEAFPEWMFEFFGIDALHTVEGFIAAEMYSFFWVVLIGVYFAYMGANMIAADVDSRRMDLTLSNPVSREGVVVQKVAALWVPLVVLNVGVALIVYVGSVAIGESMNPVAVAMVHVLGVPYLLVCAALGLVVSVLADRARRARTIALSLVVFLWLLEAVSTLNEDYEWVGAIAPTRYYDETAILVHEEYAFVDAAILLLAFVVLVGLAIALFVRRDI